MAYWGLVVVDQCHLVKTSGKGPWKMLDKQLKVRPQLWPMMVGMSGTIVGRYTAADFNGAAFIWSHKEWAYSTQAAPLKVCGVLCPIAQTNTTFRYFIYMNHCVSICIYSRDE